MSRNYVTCQIAAHQWHSPNWRWRGMISSKPLTISATSTVTKKAIFQRMPGTISLEPYSSALRQPAGRMRGNELSTRLPKRWAMPTTATKFGRPGRIEQWSLTISLWLRKMMIGWPKLLTPLFPPCNRETQYERHTGHGAPDGGAANTAHRPACAHYHFEREHEPATNRSQGRCVPYDRLQRAARRKGETIVIPRIINEAALLDHIDRKSTRLNSSHSCASRMPSSA